MDLNYIINKIRENNFLIIGRAGIDFSPKPPGTKIEFANIIRSDVTNTMDIMVTKALGDFIPFLDPNKNLFLNLSYEKVISEANIMNYDYIADSYSFSFSKAFQLN